MSQERTARSADFWRNDIGVNVIPADTKRKETYESWKEWQDKPIPQELHDEWKNKGAFDNGNAIILGRVWHNPLKKDLYLIGIDLDNQKAIEELCTREGKTISLSQLAQWTLIEQHTDDPTKAHVLLYSHKPFPKKSSDVSGTLGAKITANEIPALEVKGLGSHGIFFVSPSIHKNGYPYQIIGTKEPNIVDDFDLHLNNIFKKYSIPYLDATNDNDKALIPIEDLFKPDFTIAEGHNRHEALLRVMESLIVRNTGILFLDKIKELALEWNSQHCSPPLDDKEFEKQWKCALDFIGRKKDEDQQQRPSITITNSTKSAADILVDLATENISLLFKDQYGAAYALIHLEDDHDEIIKVENNKFKRYLSKLYYENNSGKVVNAEAITNAIQVLQAKAEFNGQTIPLHLRAAWYNGNIYYDMTDEKWHCIKISKDNWELLTHTPTPMFVRYNQISQAKLDRSYDQNIFDKFLELTNLNENDHDNRLLLKAYIVSLFIPEIPHAILILHGEKGSAKSTLQTLIKLLVDPSKPVLLTVHKDRTEFIQQLGHNYVAYYDNVKNTPEWLSDEACKAVTGVGQTKRKLYSDDDDIVYEYKRCLGFNGINISLTEPDALDRSIMIELDRISKEIRRTESEIIGEFFKLRPMLLGYIFDLLVKAIRIKPTIRLNDLPRMADFALWGEAIARAMGYKELQFMNAYYENIGKQNIEAIENHPLGQAIARFYEERIEHTETWEGSPTELLQHLAAIAQNHGINTNHKSWPKEVRWLIRRLNQIRSNLLEGLGIDIRITRVTTNVKGKVNTSSIKIRKITSITPITPVSQNHEGNLDKTTGVIPSTGEIISPMNEITPVKGAQNHAQNGETGDTGVISQLEKGIGVRGGNEGITTYLIAPPATSSFHHQHCRAIVSNLQYMEAVARKIRFDSTGTTIPEKDARLVRLEEFFNDNNNLSWQSAPEYSLEESPCSPIIVKDEIKSMGQTIYKCKVHPDYWSIDIRGIEYHCKYYEPDKHKAEINKYLMPQGKEWEA